MNNIFYHFKIAVRNLRQNGLYSAINIGGLAVSLAAVILIMLWVWDELSYDRFHKNVDNIYKVNLYLDKSCWDMTQIPLGEKMVQDMPQVERCCRISSAWSIFYLEHDGQKFFCEDRIAEVDTTFFTMFDFGLYQGDVHHLSPGSIVIDRTVARKLFGDRNSIGETVKANTGQTYEVAAVMADMPANSTIQYSMLIFPDRTNNVSWHAMGCMTYVQLRPGSDAVSTGNEVTELTKKAEPDFALMQGFKMDLQNMPQHHLYTPDGKESGIQTVRLFITIALLILLIACINYVNMVTARASKRNKEIGMRKIIGASKANLIARLMSEAALLFLVALLLALLVVCVVMPFYNNLTAKMFDLTSLLPRILAISTGVFLAVMVLAGIYPAAMLSNFRPIEVFNQKGRTNKSLLRKTLVVVQFVFSVGLLMGTLVMGRQLDYIQTMNLGYDKDHVAIVQMYDQGKNLKSIRGELLASPSITGVSAGSESISSVQTGSNAEWEGKNPEEVTMMTSLNVSEDFMGTLGLTLVEGAGFTGTAADSSYFVINETAARLMEMDDPVGKYLKFRSSKGTIAGVVKDFHFDNMHKKIGPMILLRNPRLDAPLLYVKIKPGQVHKALGEIERVWKRYNSGYQFSYHFVDETIEKMHRADLRTGILFNIFSIIAILISCLGLFGLVTYTAETKTKEIGIRKVLGANVAGIVEMLSKEFLILVGIAMLIAFPLAYYWLDKMLQDYAYRINISWWMFALAGIITVALTLLTVGWKAVKAATANPVKSIR